MGEFKIINNDYTHDISEYLYKEIEVINKLDIKNINNLINILNNARLNDKTIYIFGNGGSASTASHFQNDFNKGLSEHLDKKFKFRCLNDNISTIMAIANDISYDEIFRFQLTGNLNSGDIVIGISGSGNSQNVINAIEYAKESGNMAIGFTGFNGGKLSEIVDLNINIPINSMQITEDLHLLLDHLIMSVLYKQLCNINHIKY